MPNGWAVCSLSTIANIFNGDSINEQEKHQKYFGRTEGYNYIGTKDVNYDHSINYENDIKIPYITNLKIAHKGAPLLCIEGGNAGKKIGKLNEDVCFGNKLCAFENYGISSQYLFYFLQSSDFIKIFRQNTQGIIGGVSINTIKALPFRLPPLNEQERIAKNVDLLLSQIDIIEQNQTGIETLYDELKKRTLDLAIQGKLVPQDENDEPASVLLEKIRAEKKAKLGKKYVDSYIYKGDDNCYYEKVGSEVKNITEEILFNIPETWEWIRLKQVIDFSRSNSVSSNQLPDNAWILDLEDIEKDSGIVIRKKRMYEVKAKSDKHSFCRGNVLYSKLRPYLNKVVVADEDGYCTSEILSFDFSPIVSKYAQAYLMSPFFVDYAMSGAYGVKMPRIGSERGNNALMPLPPLQEQQRIALQVQVIFSKLKDEI